MPPLVMITGPTIAAPFLSKVHRVLVSHGTKILSRIDDIAPFDDEAWPQVEVLVAFGTPVTAAIMQRGTALRAIVVPSMGYDGVDLAAATARNIVVANGRARENFESVAEAAVLFMLMGFYDVRAAEQRLREGLQRQGPPRARMLKGKTIGLIGYGNIAREVVTRLAGWDVRIVVHTRSELLPPDDRVERVELDELLTQSDAILPLLPLTSETHHLLNRERLMSAKVGAMLINLSRGAVIDEQALTDPVIAARFQSIAMDVFEVEPLPKESPLRNLTNTIMTSHEIAHTAENLSALFELTIENALACVSGGIPSTVINPGVLDNANA